MSFTRQSLWSVYRASVAPASCIVAAGLYILARRQEFSHQPNRSRLRRYYSLLDDTNNLWSTWTQETEVKYPERDFNFRQITLYEDLTYSLAALLYGIAVGRIGILYLTFLHYAELWEIPVWFRGSFFLATLCRPWTVLRWLWRKAQRAAAAENVSRWVSLTCNLTRTTLSVALVAVSAWLFLSSATDFDLGHDADAWRVCCYASSPRLCEEMTGLLNIVAMGRTLVLVGCGRMAALYFLWAAGLPVTVRAVIVGTILAVVVAGMLTKEDGGCEREVADQEGEEEEERNKDESADQGNAQPNEVIDPRLDPRTISADMRVRAEELVEFADDIATKHTPHEHSAAINNAIQQDRAIELAPLYAPALDTPVPTLKQTINEYFRFLTPPLSAEERNCVRQRTAGLYVEVVAALNATERRSWQRHMQCRLRGAHFGVLLSRVGVAALANAELLRAATLSGMIAAEPDMVAGTSTAADDVVIVTDEDRAFATRHLPALVQALVFEDHAGGYGKLRTRWVELQTEETQMRREVESLAYGAQRLAWKRQESTFFAGLLRKLDVWVRRERRERMARNAAARAQAQAGGSRGWGRGGEMPRLV